MAARAEVASEVVDREMHQQQQEADSLGSSPGGAYPHADRRLSIFDADDDWAKVRSGGLHTGIPNSAEQR